MKRLLPFLALLAVTLPSVVRAQPESAYYGLSIGEIDYSENIFGDVFADSADSWRLMVGYQFMEHLAVEGSYGKSSTLHAIVPVYSGNPVVGFVDVDFKTELDKVLTIRILGTLPFDNGLSLMAGVGYLDFEQDVAVTVGGSPFLDGELSDNRPAYYFGVQYDWDRVALRLSYEQIDLETTIDFDGDVDVEEVSLTFFYKI